MAKKVTLTKMASGKFRLALVTPMLEFPLFLTEKELQDLSVKIQVMLLDPATEKSEIILK